MTTPLTPEELRARGMEVLVRELGYADALRFMLQFTSGRGDYTKERGQLLAGVTLEVLLRAADRRVAEQTSRTHEQESRT